MNWQIFILPVLAQWGLFTAVYLLAVKKNDFSLVDIFWSLSFLLTFILGLFLSPLEFHLATYILGFLITIWSLRLAGYLAIRSFEKKEEDFRYTAMRREWGVQANKIAYFKIFILQAFLSIIISSPIYLFHFYGQTKGSPWLLYTGAALSFIGFLIETIADFQKSQFKKLQKYNSNLNLRFLKHGLWKFSRHPNYFGEALFWWGIGIALLNYLPWYFALTGPVILNLLLLKVSGVPLLEKSYQNNSEYESYKKVTSGFILLPQGEMWAKNGTLFLFSAIAFIVMLTVTIWASLQQNLFTEVSWSGSPMWFQATIVDFYINQFILWFWVFKLEKNIWHKLIWFVLFVAFGSMGTTSFIIYRIIKKRPLFPETKILN